MGSRLSMPKGPAGTTEMSHPQTQPFPRRRPPINSRTIVAPAAAFTMAILLFVYARTSIRAAKANAQRHRDADSGGEGLDLLKESRRRHGRADKLDEGGMLGGLGEGLREQFLRKEEGKAKKLEKEKNAQRKEDEVNKIKDALAERRNRGG